MITFSQARSLEMSRKSLHLQRKLASRALSLLSFTSIQPQAARVCTQSVRRRAASPLLKASILCPRYCSSCQAGSIAVLSPAAHARPLPTRPYRRLRRTIMSAVRPTLYTYFRSSASWRVRIALNLKKIAYEPQFIRLASKGGDQMTPEFIKLNPSAQVPVLLIDGHRLCESVAILEYLEETRPEPRLLPNEPAERAKVRTIVEMINAGIQPKQNLSVIGFVAEHFGGEESRLKFAKHMVEKGLKAVEKVLESTSGKYCVGDEVTFADVLLVPQSSAIARFGIESAQFPNIMRIVGALENLPEFAAATPSAQPDFKA